LVKSLTTVRQVFKRKTKKGDRVIAIMALYITWGTGGSNSNDSKTVIFVPLDMKARINEHSIKKRKNKNSRTGKRNLDVFVDSKILAKAWSAKNIYT
jgi:hypothetical protein